MPWRRLTQRYPRAGSFIARRLDPEETLGWHVTLAFLFAALGGGLFLIISSFANLPRDSVSIDTAWNRLLNHYAFQTPTLTEVFQFITDLGGTFFLTLVISSVTLALLLRAVRRREFAYLGAIWVVGTVGGALLNHFLKSIYQRQRPTLAVIEVGGWSFPSGHAMASAVVYGLLAYLLLRVVHRSAARKLILAGAVLLIGLIGFSRVFLGAHWPTDVLGGWTAGAVWLAMCIGLAEALRRTRRAHEPISNACHGRVGRAESAATEPHGRHGRGTQS